MLQATCIKGSTTKDGSTGGKRPGSLSAAGELAILHRRMQQAKQNLEQSRQFETQAASLQAQNASLQEECSAKGSQVCFCHLIA